ncbi:MAG: DoxX family protein [Woeseiaceae bacterium]
MISIEEPLLSWVLLIARVSLAAVFLVSGVHKGLWYQRAADEFRLARVPVIGLTLPTTIALHLIASLCLILGIYAAEAALLLAAFTIVATVWVHPFWRFEGVKRLDRSRVALANLGLIGGLLVLAVAGPGGLALGAVG